MTTMEDGGEMGWSDYLTLFGNALSKQGQKGEDGQVQKESNSKLNSILTGLGGMAAAIGGIGKKQDGGPIYTMSDEDFRKLNLEGNGIHRRSYKGTYPVYNEKSKLWEFYGDEATADSIGYRRNPDQEYMAGLPEDAGTFSANGKIFSPNRRSSWYNTT